MMSLFDFVPSVRLCQKAQYDSLYLLLNNIIQGDYIGIIVWSVSSQCSGISCFD